jgi:hypothetical protein
MSDNAVAIVSAGVPLNVVSKSTNLRPQIDIRRRATTGIISANKGTIEQRVERATYALDLERTQSLNRLIFEVISSEILDGSQTDRFTYMVCKPSSSGLVSMSARPWGEGCVSCRRRTRFRWGTKAGRLVRQPVAPIFPFSYPNAVVYGVAQLTLRFNCVNFGKSRLTASVSKLPLTRSYASALLWKANSKCHDWRHKRSC